MKAWYVLHTKTASEKRVAFVLELRDIETYMPVLSTNADRRRPDYAPLFPGYLFAQLDLVAGNPSAWQWVPGFRRIVSYGETPIPVPSEVIGAIGRKIRDLECERATATSPFKTGDSVRIKEGPFADILAVFDRACTPSRRVQILLTAMNRSIKLKIEPEKLEKVAAGANGPPEERERRSRGRGRPIKG